MASNAVRSQRNSSVRHGEPNRGLATEKGSNAEARDGDVRGDSNKTREVAVGLFQSAAGAWVLIIALIFGGCCSNAWALELATSQNPASGTLITFAQFLATTLSCLPAQLVLSPAPVQKGSASGGQAGLSTLPSPSRIRLRPRAVPLGRWAVQVVLYLSTSLLNNVAFAYDIPMAVHIVFRSGGLVVNMALGWIVEGRRYSRTQIASVLLVTGGVISATLSSHGPSSLSSSSSSSSSDVGAYATGVALLSLALVLSGLMGLYQERTFRRYGSGHWRESLFYSHLLSLPLFALRAKGLAAELRAANASAPVWLGLGPASVSARLSAVRAYDFAALAGLGGAFSKTAGFSGIGFALPSFYVPLTLNVLTQLLCINGVNRLTARVSSLTVTLVLVVRKAASLAISVVILGGSTGNPGLWLGAAAVLLGTVGYSLGSRKAAPSRPAPDEKRAAITAAADADAETGTEMSDGSAVPKDGARIEANQSANEENARRQLNGASTALDKTNGSSKRRGTRS